MSAFHFEQIGVIRSPYKEKFAVPRQPGLVTSGSGELHLIAPYNQADAVRGLEAFSHLWVVFVFHQTMDGGWRPTVRPPRLGGNARMGVFATRSTFRPNPIGMSLVELKGIRCQKDQVILELGSLDLVDGTPVIDIKPYLPFAEALPDARPATPSKHRRRICLLTLRQNCLRKLANWKSAIPVCGTLS
ncbi:protein YaeB [Enterobacter cloacae]|uniref:Protein YaeB n=1 Tax=Enterobacter cloacae TaxID=550 RepID=A0A377M7P8_ENTCL|nr:protein YaeB [Enterobacter cloacae]